MLTYLPLYLGRYCGGGGCKSKVKTWTSHQANFLSSVKNLSHQHSTEKGEI